MRFFIVLSSLIVTRILTSPILINVVHLHGNLMEVIHMGMVQFSIRLDAEELEESKRLVAEFNRRHPDTPTTLQGVLRGSVRVNNERMQAQFATEDKEARNVRT